MLQIYAGVPEGPLAERMFRSAEANYQNKLLNEARRQFRAASFNMLSDPSRRSLAEMHLVVLNDVLEDPQGVRDSMRRLMETQRISQDFVKLEASGELRTAFVKAVRKHLSVEETTAFLAELSRYNRGPSPASKSESANTAPCPPSVTTPQKTVVSTPPVTPKVKNPV